MLYLMPLYPPLKTLGHIAGASAAAMAGVGLFVPILTLITASAALTGSDGARAAMVPMMQYDQDQEGVIKIDSGHNTFNVDLIFGNFMAEKRTGIDD